MVLVRNRFLRWTLRVILGLVLLIVLAGTATFFWGGPMITQLLRDKLQTIVTDQLNARLDLGAIHYTFPYGVQVADVALVAQDNGEPVTLASFKSLDIQLTKLPLWPGPLQIERIEVDQPTVHIIRTPDGFVGKEGIIKTPDQKKKAKKVPDKLSDIFHLRRLVVSKARLEYDDRRIKGTLPLVWENLDFALNAEPKDNASHAFDFTAASGQLADLTAKGVFDLDTLVLTLENMTIKSSLDKADDEGSSPLPAEVQKLAAKLDIAGAASVSVNGFVPLRDLKSAVVTAGVAIENATGALPGLRQRLEDLDLVAHATFENQKVNASVTHVGLRYANSGMSVQPIDVDFDPAVKRWTASPVRLAIAYSPVVGAPSIIDQRATLVLVATPEQGQALTDADVRVNGTVTLPTISGDVAFAGALKHTKGEVTLQRLAVTGLGGLIEMDGSLNIKNLAAVTNVRLTDVDLARLKTLLDPLSDREMRGNVTGGIYASILANDLDTLISRGKLDVTQGQFARLPLLADITSFIGIGGGAFVADGVTMHFDIAKQVMTLDRMAVSSSSFQVRGAGTIDFKKNLNLLVNVGTTSDWGGQVKKTKIPLFSDIAGNVAGTTQGMIRKATSQFTSLRVTGTVEKPTILPAPAPIIGETFDQLFRRPTVVKEVE